MNLNRHKEKPRSLRSPIRLFGGKGRITRRLLSLLPPHRTYVEVFGGGASLLFAKAPSAVEVYNDIDEGLVNFLRVLRDPWKFERLFFLLRWTPYSRLEHREAGPESGERIIGNSGKSEAFSPDVVRAWRTFVRLRQSVNGDVKGGWSFSVRSSSRGMSRCVSGWLSAVELLPAIHERLRSVQIEYLDWRRILDIYDTSETLFYLDPPYVHLKRGKTRYPQELSESDHKEIVERASRVKAKVLLSGYESDGYARLERAGWRRLSWSVDVPSRIRRKGKGIRTQPRRRAIDCVWVNYLPDGAG